MDKKAFHKKWYYKLLQLVYFSSLIVFSLFLIIAGILGSDVEVAGFFWAGVLCLVYWLAKRVFYWIMFKEKIFGKNQKGAFIGFVLGVIFALIWIFIMSKIYPEEDVAGIVIIGSLVSGLIFSFIGYFIQNSFRKNNNGIKRKKYTWRNYREYMKDNPKKLWFKMRLYGWGWIPVRWQGWVVVLAFVCILLLNGFYLDSRVSSGNTPTSLDLTIFIGAIIICVAFLFWICYKKGEWPKWSWGR